MAIHQLHGPLPIRELGPQRNFLGDLGGSLGGLLGTGIGALAHYKMEEIQQKNHIKKAIPFLQSRGATEQQAREFLSAPQHIQKAILDSAEGLSFPEQHAAPMASQQGGPALQQSAQDIPQEQSVEDVLPDEQPMTNAPQIPQAYTQREANKLLNDYVKTKKLEALSEIKARHAEGKEAVRNYYAEQRSARKQQQPGMTTVIGGNLNKQLAREKLDEEKLKNLSERERHAWNDTKKERSEINEGGAAAKDNLFRLKSMEDLAQAGDLNGQAYLTGLKAAGLEDVEALINGDTQAFNKVAADFQRGAKDVYGGRITNNELDQFLKTIPNLYQSPDGRKKIIAMMRYFNQGKIEKQKVMKKVIMENGGIPPHDLEERISDKFEPIQKHIAAKFKDELKRSLTLAEKSQGSNGFVNLLAQGAGKVVKNIPKAISGAGIGAIAGAKYGAPILGLSGAAAGGLFGGLAGLGGVGVRDVIG